LKLFINTFPGCYAFAPQEEAHFQCQGRCVNVRVPLSKGALSCARKRPRQTSGMPAASQEAPYSSQLCAALAPRSTRSFTGKTAARAFKVSRFVYSAASLALIVGDYGGGAAFSAGHGSPLRAGRLRSRKSRVRFENGGKIAELVWRRRPARQTGQPGDGAGGLDGGGGQTPAGANEGRSERIDQRLKVFIGSQVDFIPVFNDEPRWTENPWPLADTEGMENVECDSDGVEVYDGDTHLIRSEDYPKKSMGFRCCIINIKLACIFSHFRRRFPPRRCRRDFIVKPGVAVDLMCVDFDVICRNSEKLYLRHQRG